jgi:hypothetical protein
VERTSADVSNISFRNDELRPNCVFRTTPGCYIPNTTLAGYKADLDMLCYLITIKPLQQESLFLTGVCYHRASQLFPNRPSTLPRHASAHTPSNHVARTQLMHGRPVRAVAERCSVAGISDDDSLSDSDSGGCSEMTDVAVSTSRMVQPEEECPVGRDR